MCFFKLTFFPVFNPLMHKFKYTCNSQSGLIYATTYEFVEKIVVTYLDYYDFMLTTFSLQEEKKEIMFVANYF